MAKTDRRVKYTIMAIRDSFIALLAEKPVAKISIKEICERADVNRATFYVHYSDQYELLKQIEDKVIEDINNYIDGIELKEKSSGFNIARVEKILTYVKENAQLFGVLLNAESNSEFLKQFMQIVSSQHLNLMSQKGLDTQKNAEYAMYFLANGALGVIKRWLNDDAEMPERQLAELIYKLSNF